MSFDGNERTVNDGSAAELVARSIGRRKEFLVKQILKGPRERCLLNGGDRNVLWKEMLTSRNFPTMNHEALPVCALVSLKEFWVCSDSQARDAPMETQKRVCWKFSMIFEDAGQVVLYVVE